MIGSIDYSKLINKVGSKYLLCVIAAKRAEQLIDNQVRLRQGKKPAYESELVDEIGKSPLYVALREIEEGYIEPYFPEEESPETSSKAAKVSEETEIEPFDAELDPGKILDQLETMLTEMQLYLTPPEEEETKTVTGPVEIIEDVRTEESLEALQEEEIKELEEEAVEEE